MLLDGSHPRGDVGEGLLVGDVVDEEDAHGAAVVGRRDGLEPLLPRRVPDLQFDSLAVQLHAPDLKVDPNRGDEGLREGVIGKPHQNRALPHAGIPNQKEFDEHVVLFSAGRAMQRAARCAPIPRYPIEPPAAVGALSLAAASLPGVLPVAQPLDLKVDPNRGDEGLREGVIGKPHQNRALPHACAGGGRTGGLSGMQQRSSSRVSSAQPPGVADSGRPQARVERTEVVMKRLRRDAVAAPVRRGLLAAGGHGCGSTWLDRAPESPIKRSLMS
eukprot:CAMPEP_0185340838 /NCGR_PEP_ID=MMETSP1363-20130426/98327_1 /TAXON_ID=38817 /ORGANISM="Gephyrocapsa oceanica, Strain RCC1303" /LENGTH=272 /DNA_ID=CAMNT_0027940067 /DNA_START=526 /DNA_END=1342 /DNA_ORIENTATION=+